MAEAVDVDLRLDELLDGMDEVTSPIETAAETPRRDPLVDVDEKKLTNFRKKYQALFKERSERERQEKEAREREAETTPAPQSEAVPGTDVEALRAQVAEARSMDDPLLLCEALAELVEKHFDASIGFELDHAELMRLSLELGELYYYDLEEPQAALEHLERVRDEDPGGLGAKSSLLTTLEAIYEESGEVESRVRILQARLDSADTEEMATTYRLLLAQLVWDEREDAEAARGWLDEVLEADPRHESAHRLLAQMAREEGDFEAAARHLKTVLQVAGGGLDAVELERELAHLLLDELQRPKDAQKHFEQVLDAAPGDAMALEGVKQCQAALGDWHGYVSSLGHELGLLIGKPDGLSPREMAGLSANDISPAVRVPASQIVADAAHIAEEDLQDQNLAWGLWGMAFSLWPEHVEALERRIALDRVLDKSTKLADDLESYAELLLDPYGRFEALVEAATLHAEQLGRPDLARPLFAEAIAVVQDQDEPPEGLDAARRSLRALQADQEG
jgi:tetratricopeptide (TPR) repeat protein